MIYLSREVSFKVSLKNPILPKSDSVVETDIFFQNSYQNGGGMI